MKTYLLPTLALFLCAPLLSQIDYSLTNPTQSQTTICESGSITGAGVTISILDSGSNGQPTYYEFFSNDGMTVSGAGLISNGSFTPVAGIVAAPGLTPGTYMAGVRASYDPSFLVDVVTVMYTFTVRDEPVASITTPDGMFICDGTPVALEGEIGPANSATYSWAPNGETTKDIAATVSDTYTFTASNICGSDMASVTIEDGAAPVLVSSNCNGNPSSNALNAFVEVDDPLDMGLTFQWYREGVPIFSGGDFNINTNLNTGKSNLTVNHVQTNHFDADFYCIVSNACGSVVSVTCNNVNLPVEMLYFSGQVKDGAVFLEWATATEEYSDFFEVQRSFNGIDFEVVGSVPAAGFSVQDLVYSFQDDRAFAATTAPIAYYRLRQVDIDGAFEFSRLISIRPETTNSLKVEFSVRSESSLDVQVFAPRSGNLQVDVISLNGQTIHRSALLSPEGHTQFTLDDLQLPSGLYLLRVSDGFATDVHKFVW